MKPVSAQTVSTQTPALLDVATYISIVAMSLLGISGLPTLNMQLTALGLCLLFGVFYRLFFETERYRQNPGLYFGTQAFILMLLFLLGSNTTDAFNFLFLLHTIHTAVVLPTKPAVIWISIYYIIVSSIVLVTVGLDGIYALLFYLITYVVCGFFGSVLQQAEVARDRNQHLLDELQATQQKLQELAVVEERNRLARDLHDSVKQQVFAISMQLSAARTALSASDKSYQSVVEAERLAQQAGAELTTLINALRPPVLESKTLADAILDAVDEWSRQNKIAVEKRVDPSVSVSLQTEQALFRVLQEALANVARHSKASQVIVTFKTEDHRAILVVEDNGVGYDARQITKGIGLDSMKERLAAIDGYLETASDRSKGTRVIATVRRT